MTRSSLISATASSNLVRLALAALMAGLVAAPQARAAADPPLAGILQHIGKQVEKFWTNFSSVTCTETVNQSKVGEKNKVLFQQRQTFDYLIALQSSGQEISVDESRVEKVRAGSRSGSKGTKVSLLETNGFGILSLIFHPLYQSRYEFQQGPDEYVQNHRLICLNFQQVSRDHPLSVLRLRELEYPLEWRGKAWIDPVTWSVSRIQAGLGDSKKDIGLLRLDADVTYSDVHFGGAAVYSLPALAIIDAETKRQHWHNTHAFTGYKRFTVDTDVKIGTPQ